jgi:outer membrane scaffolding protein for murein synthesis (MipA/OmpV family)
MHEKRPAPGVSRADRLSEEGLKRLEKQLETGAGMSDQILLQWVRRYGEPARDILKRHGRYDPQWDSL